MNFPLGEEPTKTKPFIWGIPWCLHWPKKKDFTPQIVCYALKLSQEEIANLIKVHYWDLDKTKFEQAGFVFIKLKLDFYPPLDKKD